MTGVQTHYDNLKVARDAPPEVIRAAYRTLSQKFHPDRNPGNSEAARIMSIINRAYEVLSSPDMRRQHDAWIRREVHARLEASPMRRTRPIARPLSFSPRPGSVAYEVGAFVAHVFRNWMWYAIVFLIVWAGGSNVPDPYRYYAPTSHRPRISVVPAYVRPAVAPNGQPWPTASGYLEGFELRHTGGLSRVTVDNSQNSSDVLVELVSLEGAEASVARRLYVPAYSQFTLDKIKAGSYDLRHRDLNSGALSRSNAFTLEQLPTDTGARYSNLTMRLYRIGDGNIQSYALAEAELQE